MSRTSFTTQGKQVKLYCTVSVSDDFRQEAPIYDKRPRYTTRGPDIRQEAPIYDKLKRSERSPSLTKNRNA